MKSLGVTVRPSRYFAARTPIVLNSEHISRGWLEACVERRRSSTRNIRRGVLPRLIENV